MTTNYCMLCMNDIHIDNETELILFGYKSHFHKECYKKWKDSIKILIEKYL